MLSFIKRGGRWTEDSDYARSGSVASLPRIITFSLQTHPLLEKPGDATD